MSAQRASTVFSFDTVRKEVTPCGIFYHLFILVRLGLEHIFGPLNVQQNIGETANGILKKAINAKHWLV